MSLEYLEKILNHKKKVLKEHQAYYSSLKDKLASTNYNRYGVFKKRIAQPNRINLIAEIKKASPSKGMIREDFDLMAIAKTYVEHKADAISILTEDKYFLGKPGYIKKVSDTFNVPVLTKDFFLEEGQVYEARYNGASAILLIVAILTDERLKTLYDLAVQLDLDCLVEIHDEKELKRALAIDCEIIGINNRDLTSFDVDLNTCEKLIPLIPKDKVIVAESGIHTADEIVRLKALGANAVLIGETFMREKDIGKKMDELMRH